MYLDESFIVIKDLNIPPMIFRKIVKKEALSQACPDEEIALIMPSSNPSTPL